MYEQGKKIEFSDPPLYGQNPLSSFWQRPLEKSMKSVYVTETHPKRDRFQAKFLFPNNQLQLLCSK